MTELIPRAHRREIVSPVRLEFDDSKNGCDALSVNVSTTGMLVKSETAQPEGTGLTFGFSLFEGRGEVVWSAEADDGATLLGMRFLSFRRQEGKGAGARDGGARAPSGPSFAEVTDVLLRSGITRAEIGYALGESTRIVRMARLDPSSHGYRPPPDDWRVQLASVAKGRGEALDALARQLEADDRS